MSLGALLQGVLVGTKSHNHSPTVFVAQREGAGNKKNVEVTSKFLCISFSFVVNFFFVPRVADLGEGSDWLVFKRKSD